MLKKISMSLISFLLVLLIFPTKVSAKVSPESVNYEDIEGLVSVQLVGYIDENGKYIILDEPKVIFQRESADVIPQRETRGFFTTAITMIVGGLLYSFIVGLTGVDIAYEVGKWVRNKLIELYGYLPDHTYRYVVDNGCWSPEFPSNPFCRLVY